MPRAPAIVLLLVGGALYWQGVCHAGGVTEPWDAASYWRLWYPLSVLIAASGGMLLRRRAWLAGAIVTFAQLPVMWLNAGTAESWIVGVAFCAALAIPAVLASALAGRFVRRQA